MKRITFTVAIVALVMVTASVASARESVPGDTIMELNSYRQLGEGDDFPGMWEYVYDAVGTTDAAGYNYTHFSDGYLNGLDAGRIANRWKSGWFNPDGVVDDLNDPFGSSDDYYVDTPILWDPGTATDPWNYRVRQLWCANSAGIPRGFGGGLYPDIWPSNWGTEEAWPGGPLIGVWIEPTDPNWDSTSWAYDNQWHDGTEYGQGNIIFTRGGVSIATRTQEWGNAGADGIVGPVWQDAGPDGIPGNEDDTYVDDDFYTYYVTDYNSDEVWFENTSNLLMYYGSTGLFLTVRIVSPDAPGEITGSTYHTGGERVTDTMLGPLPPPELPDGDVDRDGDVDVDDIDALCDFLRGEDPVTGYRYDLSDDGEAANEGGGVVDMDDLDFLVHYAVETTVGIGTEYGDFNLDGLVDTTDLTRMATYYGAGDWGWDDGNANRNIDTNIDNTDLTILATYYGFGEPDTIPEPATIGLLAVGGVLGLIRRKK